MKLVLSFRSVVSVIVCGIILVSCGGGGGGSKSGLKKNDILGSIPAIYDEYRMDNEKADEKYDKMKTDNPKKFQENRDKYRTKYDERKTKFDAKVKAEWENIKGKDVPFKYSEKFTKKVEALSVKFSDEPGFIVVSFAATDDFKESLFSIALEISFDIVTKDGSKITNSVIYLPNERTYTKGQALKTSNGDDPKVYLHLSSTDPALWVDFAGIEFN